MEEPTGGVQWIEIPRRRGFDAVIGAKVLLELMHDEPNRFVRVTFRVAATGS